MELRVNERRVQYTGEATVGAVQVRFKADADVAIRNGYPAESGDVVAGGDSLVFIRRGEVPGADELEALLVARHTPGVHRVVKAARVGIAGLGGLGSPVAIALARLGVGALVLADFDVVEPSNLNRQQYFVDQLGMSKVDALADTLRRVHPYTALETHCVRLTPHNLPRVFAGCRVLVEAFDRADQKAMLVETALRYLPQTWVVAASGLAGCGPIAKMGCHRVGERLLVVGDLEAEARPGQGLMAPRVGVAAHMQANAVLRILLGEEPG